MSYPNIYGTVTATIGSAGSVSGSVFLNGAALLGVANPGTWTDAPLSFQITYDPIPPHSGGVWVNLRDAAGLYTLPISGGTWAIAIPPTTLPRVQWLRAISGTIAGGVAGTLQTGDRSLIFMTGVT